MEVVPDFSGFGRKFNQEMNTAVVPAGTSAGKKAGKGVGGGIIAAAGKFAGPIALAFGGLQIGKAVGNTIADGISQASDLQEAGTAIAQVFGDQAGAIEEFAQAGATAFGENEINVLRAAQSFGVYGKAAGLANEDLTGFTTDLVSLGTDLASFYNTSTDQAVNALAAGLRGESEPLRQYGVLLDDATLKARAMELGIYDGAGALTQQQKVLAAQAEIMAQTADAQGDFERTSGGLANQQRILAAGWDNVVTQIGELFLPIVTQVVTFLASTVVPALAGFFEALNSGDASGFAGVFESIGSVLGPIGAAIGEIAPLFLDLFLNASPLMILFKALQPVLPIIAEALGQLASVIGGALSTVLQTLMPVIVQLVTILSGVFQQVLAAIIPIITLVAEVFAKILVALSPLITAIGELVGVILGLLMPILDALMPIITAVIDLFIAILAPVLELVGVIIDALMPVIQALIDILTGLINFVIGVFTGNWEQAWEGVQQIFNGFVDGVAGIINGLFDILGGIVDFIFNLFAGVGDWLVNAGQSLIQGFIDGITSMIGAVGDAVGGVLDWAAGFFPNSPAERGPFSGQGWRNVASGGAALMDQFTGGFNTADDMLQFGGLNGALAPRVAVPAPIATDDLTVGGTAARAGRDGVTVNIYNPERETPSTSIQKTYSKIAYLGLDDMEAANA
ncbi:phage tail protein [Agromyces sp. SYSU T00194]|uniref:phage tail protein n=1 Tax=Agromyces chitinivorans TaxID=3158560 RepID=UPI003398645B